MFSDGLINVCSFFYFFIFFCSEHQLHRRRAEAFANGLHPPAGPGAGEGVPLQPVPDAQAQGGDRAHTLSVRAADQNLVPEPEDEMEEGSQASQHQGPLRVKQHKLPGSDWFPKPHRTPIAVRDFAMIYAPSLLPLRSLMARLNAAAAAMLLATRACTLDRNNAFALEEKMDATAASLVPVSAETADCTLSQHEMCVGVGDFPIIKKQKLHEQKRRQKLKKILRQLLSSEPLSLSHSRFLSFIYTKSYIYTYIDIYSYIWLFISPPPALLPWCDSIKR